MFHDFQNRLRNGAARFNTSFCGSELRTQHDVAAGPLQKQSHNTGMPVFHPVDDLARQIATDCARARVQARVDVRVVVEGHGNGLAIERIRT